MPDNDGATLAMQAMAEVLTKMDSRLNDLGGFLAKMSEREEEEKEEELKKSEELRKAAEHQALVNDAASAAAQAVLAAISKANDQGMEVDGTGEKKVSGGDTWPMSDRPAAEDGEDKVTVDSATSEVQKPIQARRMAKGYGMKDDYPPMDPAMDPAMDEEVPSGSEPVSEYPEEEDGFAEDEVMAMQRALTKMGFTVTKSAPIAKSVKAETKIRKSIVTEEDVESRAEQLMEERLSKMGFHRERDTRPRVTSVPSGDMPIAKSAGMGATGEDVTDFLVKNISLKQLHRWDEQIKAGDYAGIPAELLPRR